MDPLRRLLSAAALAAWIAPAIATAQVASAPLLNEVLYSTTTTPAAIGFRVSVDLRPYLAMALLAGLPAEVGLTGTAETTDRIEIPEFTGTTLDPALGSCEVSSDVPSRFDCAFTLSPAFIATLSPAVFGFDLTFAAPLRDPAALPPGELTKRPRRAGRAARDAGSASPPPSDDRSAGGPPVLRGRTGWP